MYFTLRYLSSGSLSRALPAPAPPPPLPPLLLPPLLPLPLLLLPLPPPPLPSLPPSSPLPLPRLLRGEGLPPAAMAARAARERGAHCASLHARVGVWGRGKAGVNAGTAPAATAPRTAPCVASMAARRSCSVGSGGAGAAAAAAAASASTRSRGGLAGRISPSLSTYSRMAMVALSPLRKPQRSTRV
jgi:hypothetical protein